MKVSKRKYFSAANISAVDVGDQEWKPSLTQPDESLSIRQILARVANGYTTGLDQFAGNGEYDDEDNNDFDDPTLDPEFDKLDALAFATSEEADELREQEIKRKERARKKKHDDAIEAEVQRRLQTATEKPNKDSED